MTPIRPYEPCPIEGFDVSLTKRKMLAHVRKALAMSRDAKRYWPHAEWSALLADLERQEADLAAEIQRTDEAIYGKSVLRAEFVNVKNGLTTVSIIRLPNDKMDMPWIPAELWPVIKRLVNDPTGENIEVNANYDVNVGSKNGCVSHIIPRYE